MSTQMPEPDETRSENQEEIMPGDMPEHLDPNRVEDRTAAELEQRGQVNQSPPSGPATPGEGEVANEEVTQARRDIETELNNGDMDLEDVFEQSDSERSEGTTHRVVGHMHIKAALAAYLNDSKAEEILDSAGITHDTHIDAIGSNQRTELIDLIEAFDA